MKVSLNTIKQYIDFELPPTDDLVRRINEQLGGVEKVIDLASKYKDAKIVKVVECEKHPDADRLSVCKIDAGSGELVQVVCGAPNVRAGMWAVWLPPESIVPSTYGTSDEFKLGSRELRGVMSNGMLAAADELAIGTDRDGILEINLDEWKPGDVEIAPGVSFSEVYGLNDTIIDIENKMFTHRPDLFGQLGVAREIAGIFNQQFKERDWYWHRKEFEVVRGLELEVFNEAAEKVPRLMFVAMKNVTVRPSPLWLQCALVAMGGKPINNIVDVTNYVMLLTAQPAHAYDYDKIHGHKIGVRMAQKGETIQLLNGKSYELTEDDIVIADGEGAISLGGVMGGSNSEVSHDTKNIILEVATFDMYTVRKSSMRHGLFTDALTRFNKGQSPLQNDRIIQLLMTSMCDVSAAEQASEIFDLRSDSLRTAYEAQSLSGAMKIEAIFINERLGLNLQEPEIQQLLGNVRFACFTDEGDSVTSFTAPFWRTDIQLPEDIVEEVGRLYGFDKLPRELPMRSMGPATKNMKLAIKQKIRTSLSRAGANEVLTYSFVHENIMKKAEQDVEQAFILSNALSPDLQYYRLSVLPSLLDKVHANIKAGHDEFVLFELGKGHNKKYHAQDDDGLPSELEFVDAVYASKQQNGTFGAPFYQMRMTLDQLAQDLNIKLVYKTIGESLDFPVTAPFDQGRSALVETEDGVFIGMVGELKQSVRSAFKLPPQTAAMTLDLTGLVTAGGDTINYKPLSRLPSVSQDVSVKVASTEPYVTVFADVCRVLDSLVDGTMNYELTPLGVYQSADDATMKTISLRLIVASQTRSLTDAEIATMLDAVLQHFA